MTNAATEATQLPPRRRLVGDARSNLAAELRLKYENGATLRELTEEYGTSYGRVHGLLREAGTEMRSRGGMRGRF